MLNSCYLMTTHVNSRCLNNYNPDYGCCLIILYDKLLLKNMHSSRIYAINVLCIDPIEIRILLSIGEFWYWCRIVISGRTFEGKISRINILERRKPWIVYKVNPLNHNGVKLSNTIPRSSFVASMDSTSIRNSIIIKYIHLYSQHKYKNHFVNNAPYDSNNNRRAYL